MADKPVAEAADAVEIIRDDVEIIGDAVSGQPGLTGAPGRPSVFLSYRIADTGDLVAQFADRLREDLGGRSVFRDADSLIGGQKFQETIDAAIEDADVTMFVVGPEWAGMNEKGVRISQADDPVAAEIRVGLASESTLVPIFVDIPGPPSGLVSDADELFEHHGIRTSRSDLAAKQSRSYQAVLVAVWEAIRRKTAGGTLILSESGSEIRLDKLVEELQSSKLVDARKLSQLAAGVHVAPSRRFRRWARRVPDVIVVADREPSPEFAARIAAVAKHPRLHNIAMLGAGIGAGLAVAAPLLGHGASVTANTVAAQFGTNALKQTAGYAATTVAGASAAAKVGIGVGAFAAAALGASATGLLGADIDLPIQARYGVVDVELTNATALDVHPDPAIDDEDFDYFALDVELRNSLRDVSLGVPAALFHLEGGNIDPTSGFLVESRTIQLEPENTEEATIYFAVPAGTSIDQPEIVLFETGTEPLRLPLSEGGDVSEVTELSHAPESFSGEVWVTTMGIEFPGAVWIDANVAINDRGDPLLGTRALTVNLGGCGFSDLGRVFEGQTLLHIPATAQGRAGGIAALNFNAINFSIPVLVEGDGAPLVVCEGFGDLNGSQIESEFQVVVPNSVQRVELVGGCPCGGVLTGNDIETELFRVAVDLGR